MKICNKCKSELEANSKDVINYQTIVLYDRSLDLCNDCCRELVDLINNSKEKDKSDEIFLDEE